MPAFGLVDGVVTAREKNLIKTEHVCLGRGLIDAFEQAFQYLPDAAKVDDIICDMNGEPYRGDEFGFATLRTAARFADRRIFRRLRIVGAMSAPRRDRCS